MKNKGKMRRILSGILAAVTILQTVATPAYAAEPEIPETVPLYEEVKELLDADEVVTAKDHELEYGSIFEPSVDFTGIEILDNEKVQVTYQEAKNEEGKDFSTSYADSYKAVYYVEPKNPEHPKYRINRMLIVKEPVTETQTEQAEETVTVDQTEETEEEETQSQLSSEEPLSGAEPESETEALTESGTEESEETSEPFTEDVTEESEKITEPESLNEEDLDQALEEAESEDTLDEESGLTLGDVLEQAAEHEIDLLSLEEGEAVSFMAVDTATKAVQNVDVIRGNAYYYADYGLGSYVTYQYTVKFGAVSATAYCVQPSRPGPGDGKYTITKLKDGKTLAKVCYYGTKSSGDEGFFAEKYPDFSTGKRFIITHLAASYANGSSDAFSGANSTARALAMELYQYCVEQPSIPEVDMEFSEADTTAYIDGNIQRTKEIKFQADELQSITMKLPDGVKLHNVTTGKTSKPGADVQIYGGTTFYLSAPLTQTEEVGGSWSIKMKGSITKDYSAYKITTGSETQDLALVFGEGVDDEKYIHFKVTWVSQAQVSIIKRDKASGKVLAGAIYGLYSDKACKNLIKQMPPTDAKGASSVTLQKTQDTIYLREISVPKGYVLDTTAYGVNLVVGENTVVNVTDEEQLASITVYKNGEALTGANVTDSGVTFIYTEKRQKGAVYNVYAAQDIKAADGRIVYRKGALVKEGLTTGNDGSATLSNLHLGKYTVKEMKAPTNLVCTGESKDITLEYAGSNVEVAVGKLYFTNARQKALVSVEKQDGQTKTLLAGGVYGLYAGGDIKNDAGSVVVKKDTLIEKVTTGENGKAPYGADLPIGNRFYIKELKAPDGYVRNSADVYSFTFQYTNDKEATVTFSHVFQNERVDAKIQLKKKDKEAGDKPQGDATLKGAVYGLYAREDIRHPDKKSGVIYKAGTQVATLTTDESGSAEVRDLYLGKYYIKEITPPVGYLLDEKEYDIDCSYEGDQTVTVERTATSTDQVKKQPFQLIKAANNGQTDAELLKGAGFTAYLISSLKVKEDGSYDFDSAQPVVLTADGKTEMFTDARGYACSIALPFGSYVVRETTTPHNFKPVADFIVTISENRPNEPQTWRVLLDDEFQAKLKIIKKDDETKQPVLVPNAEFKVYDMDKKEYVEQVTTYPVTQVHTSYFTDSKGYLILPNALNCGNYRIEEVTAPDGYTQNPKSVEVKIDSDTAYQMDIVSGDAIIEVSFENHPVKGKLIIQKKGETLDSFHGDFHYKEQELSGASFEIYAAEDIYTADHQIGGDGNRILEYAKDALVTVVTTDENGEAFVEDLPLGTYRIIEKKAPTGFVWNDKPIEVTFTYEGQDVPVVEETAEFTNERQKVSICVVKQDVENEAVVEGAVFGIYNKTDIVAHGKTIVVADTLLQKVTSDTQGEAVFTLDLSLGGYYVKELAAPAGYVSSDEVLEFDASYQGQDVAVIKLETVKKNEPTEVSFTKSDITSGVELDGALMSVLDKAGNVIDSWTSVKDEPHIIKRLTVGETYILREDFAPYGYLKTTDVEFTVTDTAEIQKVEMKDDVPKALLIINKKGEFLDKITLVDSIKGVVEHLFEYVTGNLTPVTFEVYAAEDIHAADGVSADYYAKDELVATITTDDNGIAKAEDLPVGKYYVKEVETANGYVLDGEPRYVDLTYRDQDTPIVVYDEDWQNNRQKVTVNVLKKEKGTDKPLKGAIFGLYTAEDILSASGAVLMEADSIIERKTTGEDGKIAFVADLPVGGKYYVKEEQAPDGFVTTNEVQEFEFTYQGQELAEVTYDFMFENEQTTVEFSKTDLTTGEELPGSTIHVIDENANVVDEWVSTNEPHIIKGLIVGASYTMIETIPASGYVTAESIDFVVENTAEPQRYEMKDDVTKVEITKTDITGKKEVPGAKLSILDKDGKVVDSWTSTREPHYIEKLPIGTYTLHEEQAPKGYILTEDVVFEVKDDGVIQKVQMKNDTAKGQLILWKTDQKTKEPLKGVEFELRDSQGKVLEKLVTDGDGKAESSLYEIASFKNGEFKKELKYYLVETKALDGYVLDETEHEIIFTYEDEKTPVVKVELKLENQPGTPTDSPKTGDDTNIWIPIAIMGVCVIAFAGITFAGRKKKRG